MPVLTQAEKNQIQHRLSSNVQRNQAFDFRIRQFRRALGRELTANPMDFIRRDTQRTKE
jgi:hypothetical protein